MESGTMPEDRAALPETDGFVAPTRHCTVVAIAGHGVLIMGASGAGKTSLAFGLVESCRRDGIEAAFVADDRAVLTRRENGLVAAAPPAIAGKAELRGFGVVDVPNVAEAPVVLVARLVADATVPRMPEAGSIVMVKCRLPMIDLPRRHEAQGVRIVRAWLAAHPA